MDESPTSGPWAAPDLQTPTPPAELAAAPSATSASYVAPRTAAEGDAADHGQYYAVPWVRTGTGPTMAQALAGAAAARQAYGYPAIQPIHRPRGTSVFALVFTTIAIALTVVSMTAVDWISRTEGLFTFHASFNDVRHLIADNRQFDHYPWDIDSYYTYASFIVLGVALVAAVLAAFDTPWRHYLRIATVIAGLVGLAWTFDVVVHLVKFGGGNFGDIGSYYGAGPWMMMFGDLLIVFAGLSAGSNVTARYR